MKQIQNPQVRYTFRRDQIETADVREFLTLFDPFRLPGSRVRDLFGNVVIDFEGVDCAVPAHQEVRVLLRRLHARWPWSGFFLDLNRPLGAANPVNQSPLLVVGMALSDLAIIHWEVTNRYGLRVGPQLNQYQSLCHDVVNRLGKRAQLPARVIKVRHTAIDEQFKQLPL
jgi:hypothetical protein